MSSFGGPRLIPTVPEGSSRPNKTTSVKKSKFSKLTLIPFCQITAVFTYLKHLNTRHSVLKLIKKTCAQIKTYTGLKNGVVFKSLLKYLRSQHNPTSITYAITGNNSCSLSYEDQLLLTLKKLRLGSTDATLASDFQVFSV